MESGCGRCGHPPRPGHGCWLAGSPVTGTIVLYDYCGPVPRAVVAAKVRGAHAGWQPLGAALGRRVAEQALEVDAVTYVTTPAARVRARGFDHAALLAQAVAGALGLPVVGLLAAVPAAGGAQFRSRGELPGSDLLLVDDVLTTGVTAWRAAAALRRSGAGEVTLGVLARAGRHPLGAAARDAARPSTRRWSSSHRQ